MEEQVQEAAAPKRRVVVVGGGLAGCVAALQAWQRVLAAAPGGAASRYEVVLVDKMPKLGGNSMKASSGINALNPAGGDSQELFEKDTIESGGGRSKQDLVSTLVVRASLRWGRWLVEGHVCFLVHAATHPFP